jgi:hypothetical protein
MAKQKISAQRLADLIVAEWLDSHIDSGNLWKQSWQALQIAKQDAGEKMIEEAYKLAVSRLDAMRRDV